MRRRRPLIYCTLALLAFAVLSWTAAKTESATSDEPLHAAASYVALRYGDFRANPEHPILWKYYAALPLVLLGPPLDAHLDSPVFHGIPGYLNQQWVWCIATVYRTDANDPQRFIFDPRFMMLLVAVALGALLYRFARVAAGPLAGCVAVTLYCLDPNFLAHGSLVTNDVAITFLATALTYALYRAGRRLTVPRVLLLAVLTAACITTKYTGILAAPALTLTLLARALLPAAWPVTLPARYRSFSLTSRARRLAAAGAIVAFCAVFTYAGIWAVYRFRFGIDPNDPSRHFDVPAVLADAAEDATKARYHTTDPTPEQIATWRPDFAIRADVYALDHHLFPEAFLQGLLHAYAHSENRRFYLLGEAGYGGRWYYFPVAIAVKTPLATLAALAAAAALLLVPPLRRRLPKLPGAARPGPAWLWVCVLIPAALYGGSAVASNMDIGLRHIFPVYPALFLAVAVAAARAHAAAPRVVRPVLVILFLGLAAETLSAYPNYIPFFNTAAGGYRGGFHLLSDSNLDWGQDLPLLAKWQRAHPGRTLHFAYFGNADPWYYGIQYRNLPGGYEWGPPKEKSLPTSGVVAVSAMILQGDWKSEQTGDTYAPLLRRQPTEILGGSIYLYDLGGD